MRYPPRSAQLAVLIPFAIVTLIWGSTWIVIRDQLASVPPAWSVTYRFVLAGAATLAWAAVRREPLLLDARGMRFAGWIALSQFALNYNFVYVAEEHITSGVVAICYALLLVPNALLARIFLGQRMGRQLLLGSTIAVAGVVLLFVHEMRLSARGPHEALLGIAFALAGVVCASIANVMQATPTAKSYPIVPMLGWAMLIGAAMDGVFALATAGPPMIESRPAYAIGIVYLGLFGSTLSFALYFALIRTIGPAKAAYTGVAIPVVAMLFSSLFEGYRWSLLAGLGCALAVAGLVLALSARRPNR